MTIESIYETTGQFVLYCIAIYLVYKLSNIVWMCWLGAKLGFGVVWKGNCNTWAIVTGASDGLGFEFARIMAQKGYAVLLISRTLEKLKAAKHVIKSEFPSARLRIFQYDLSNTENFVEVHEAINALNGQIDVLINNCGQTYEYPEHFHEIPNCDELTNSIIKINVISTTKLLQIVIPKMCAAKRGIIINVGSMSSLVPVPYLSLYSASKSYLDCLSRALAKEYAAKGITMQYLLPAYCKTKLTRVHESVFVPTAKNYVKCAINTVGLETCSEGYWAHKLLWIVLLDLGNVFPYVRQAIVIKWLLNVRKRYLNKNQRKNKIE